MRVIGPKRAFGRLRVVFYTGPSEERGVRLLARFYEWIARFSRHRGDANLPQWAQMLPVAVDSLIVLLLVGLLLAAIRLDSLDGMLWALALLVVGMFVGFLFALPRVVPTPANKDDEEDDGTKTSEGDALREIADWLTKIIVGLGLVHLAKVPDLLESLSGSMAQSDSISSSAGLAMAVFFPLIGLLVGYLFTRLYLQTALVRGDREALREAGQLTLPEFEDNMEMAVRHAVIGDLANDATEPSEPVQELLKMLNDEHAAVRIRDFRKRVLRKNDITEQMYVIALKNKVGKKWLVKQEGDGYLHVLATWILARPNVEDVSILLDRGKNVVLKHTMFRMCEAFKRLAETRRIQESCRGAVIKLLDVYLAGADPGLAKQIKKTRHLVETAEPPPT